MLERILGPRWPRPETTSPAFGVIFLVYLMPIVVATPIVWIAQLVDAIHRQVDGIAPGGAFYSPAAGAVLVFAIFAGVACSFIAIYKTRHWR